MKRSQSSSLAVYALVLVAALLSSASCQAQEDCTCGEGGVMSARNARGEVPWVPEERYAIRADGDDERDGAEHSGRDEQTEPAIGTHVDQEDPSEDMGCIFELEDMACVPAGYFVRGVAEDEHECDQHSQPEEGNMGTTPSSRVWLSTYYVDRTEVTNAAYSACIAAGDCEEDGPRYADFDAPQQPITGLSWYNARRFCEAQGKHLITEAEWEKAARGPEGDHHPWGNEPATCERAIIADESGRACGVRKRGNHPENGRVWEVASRPAGRYGLYDMIGNAEEWVADYWSGDWSECGEACAGTDPQGACAGQERCTGRGYRVVRGGSWYWPAEHATGFHRRAYRPSNEPPHHFGFRCAASLDEARALAEARSAE